MPNISLFLAGMRSNAFSRNHQEASSLTGTFDRCLLGLPYTTAYVQCANIGGYLQHTHTHTRLMALCPGLPGWAGTRKAKPIWILLKQETVSGSGISWAICKSAPRSRQITMPTPHHSVFYRPDALPLAQPTVSKHWRWLFTRCNYYYYNYNHLTASFPGQPG